MSKNRQVPFEISFAIGILSIALISFQLAVIQLISNILWHHFAYIIISIALLGFGTAGSIISLFRKVLIEKYRFVFSICIILTSLFMPLSIKLMQTEPFYFEMFLIFYDLNSAFKFILTVVLFFSPFLFGALAIGLTFDKYSNSISYLYYVNMLGSGIGGIMLILLLWILPLQIIVNVLAILILLTGIISIPKYSFNKFYLFFFLSASIIAYILISPSALRISEYKGIKRTLNLPETKIIYENSSPYGILQFVSTEYSRYFPGLSTSYTNDIKLKLEIFNNGDRLGGIYSYEDSYKYFHYSTLNLPYKVRDIKNVLILNSGDGNKIFEALECGAENITAVEPNTILIENLTLDRDGLFYPIYKNENVHIVTEYPRTFLKSASQKFSLIELPIIDAFGGSSGLYSIKEQYLLTKESFSEMFALLDKNGMISISTWIDYPYKNVLKILSTISEVLEDEDIMEPRNHIAAVKNWNLITIAVKKNGFNNNEVDNIMAFCSEMNFDPVILKGMDIAKRDYFNKLQDSTLYNYIDQILNSERGRDSLYSIYPLNIKPSTDNKPFFSQFIKLEHISKISDAFGNYSLPFIEISYLFLYITFIPVLILSAILILFPQFLLRSYRRSKIQTFLYFSGIGLGYIFIEIIFIQQFILYLGNVIYSVSAVISLMLISSGAGSYYSGKIKMNLKQSRKVFLIIIGCLIVYSILLMPFMDWTSGYSFILKIFFTVLIVMPISFIMGMPFPNGIKMLSEKFPDNIPWAWGINGFFSVIGTVFAAILAVEFGFIIVITLSAVFYIIPYLSLKVN